MNNNKRILLIVAAGKSTRFGGVPKAFCSLGDKVNVENTIFYARPYFDAIFVGVNEETFPNVKDKLYNVVTFPIVTGCGDADSIYKCLLHIEKDFKEYNGKITICWGDAVFLSDVIFREMRESEGMMNSNISVVVASSLDKHPYAWFETEGLIIKKSHFSKIEGMKRQGIHDQSVFLAEFKRLKEYLENFREFSGLTEQDLYVYSPDKTEIKLLDAFSWFYENKNLKPACIYMVTANQILSFNTQKELEIIQKKRYELMR